MFSFPQVSSLSHFFATYSSSTEEVWHRYTQQVSCFCWMSVILSLRCLRSVRSARRARAFSYVIFPGILFLFLQWLYFEGMFLCYISCLFWINVCFSQVASLSQERTESEGLFTSLRAELRVALQTITSLRAKVNHYNHILDYLTHAIYPHQKINIFVSG